jgi:hypothetical protein
MAYVPYGYTVKDGVITVDEKAAGQVKEFFEKYISWSVIIKVQSQIARK